MTQHTSDRVSRALSPMPPLHGGHNFVTQPASSAPLPDNYLPDNGTPAPYCSTTSASDLSEKKNIHAHMPHNAYIMIFHWYHIQKKIITF